MNLIIHIYIYEHTYISIYACLGFKILYNHLISLITIIEVVVVEHWFTQRFQTMSSCRWTIFLNYRYILLHMLYVDFTHYVFLVLHMCICMYNFLQTDCATKELLAILLKSDIFKYLLLCLLLYVKVLWVYTNW